MKKLLTVCLALSFVSISAFAGRERASDDCQKVYKENAIEMIFTYSVVDHIATGATGYLPMYRLIKQAKKIKAEGGELKFTMRRFMNQKQLVEKLGFVPKTEQIVDAVLEGNNGAFCLDKTHPMTYKEVTDFVAMKLKGD
jgi:predicted acetyltransferase